MSRFQIYLRTASQLIHDHGGKEPLSLFLKKFFGKDKKYGSRDRKAISSIVYSYYRAGHALGRKVTDENLLHALFLCGTDGHGTLTGLAKQLAEKIHLPVQERLAQLGIRPTDIFPFTELLSAEIDQEAYCLSLLEQPDLFLRIRPGKEQSVLSKLTAAGLGFEKIGDDAVRLSNQSPVDSVLSLNREAVVQDLSSQQVLKDADLFVRQSSGEGMLRAWDCCAASGGKSILLHDRLNGRVQITLSDIRGSILANAKKRLQEAGVAIQDAFVADLTKGAMISSALRWPLILADLPCTGSGTWARTPEQLYYFDAKNIGQFAERQTAILHTVSEHLLPGGFLIYITCSVFSAENELLLDQALPQYGLKMIDKCYIPGMGNKADSMFVAICSR